MEKNHTPVRVRTRIVVVDHQQPFIQYVQKLIGKDPQLEFLLGIENGAQLLDFLKSPGVGTNLIIIGTIKEKSEIDSMAYARYITRYFPQIRLVLINFII